MRRSVVAIALTLGVAAAACGGGDDSSSVNTDASTTTSVAPTTLAPTTLPPTTAPPVTAPPVTQPHVTTCQVENLNAQFGQVDSGAGQRHVSITFTNSGQIACTMFGYIGLQLRGPGNSVVPTNVFRDPSQPKTLVTIQPGAQAFTTLQWTVVPSGSEPQMGPCEPEATQIQITSPNETESLVQPWTFGVVCGGGRIATLPMKNGAGQ
jgi:uncharacterized protein DUF4232